MQKFRKAISLTALWAFGLLILTSIILYIVPVGRVAYWADWRLWGLTKTQWGELHINLGLLFLIAGGLHIYLNWNAILVYLKTRSKRLRIFTRDFNIATALTALVMLGTYYELPPFSTVIAVSSAIKDAGAVKYGEPPYGHAELSSLKTFADRMGWNLGQSLARLEQNGFQMADAQLTLKDAAVKYGVTPQQIYQAMQPAAGTAPRTKLPVTPPPGIGRQTLADLGRFYQIDIPELLRALEAQKIGATADLTIKEIAEQDQRAPQDLYGLIKRLADAQ
jgi:hypothetical protein